MKKTETKKSVKKTKKPEFIVNAYNVETANDININVVYAKVRAGKPITESELDSVIINYTRKAVDFMAVMTAAIWCSDASCVCPKKQPWYKRFWNWLTHKK